MRFSVGTQRQMILYSVESHTCLRKSWLKSTILKRKCAECYVLGKRILEWMVLNDIRKSDQVSQVVTEYYVRPQEVLARVDGLR